MKDAQRQTCFLSQGLHVQRFIGMCVQVLDKASDGRTEVTFVTVLLLCMDGQQEALHQHTDEKRGVGIGLAMSLQDFFKKGFHRRVCFDTAKSAARKIL